MWTSLGALSLSATAYDWLSLDQVFTSKPINYCEEAGSSQVRVAPTGTTGKGDFSEPDIAQREGMVSISVALLSTRHPN